jgi:hypothetical protein
MKHKLRESEAFAGADSWGGPDTQTRAGARAARWHNGLLNRIKGRDRG